MHILIIEDEEQLCRSIAEGLRMDGYETDTCLDGDEGLELCTTENYDLILLDLNFVIASVVDSGKRISFS